MTQRKVRGMTQEQYEHMYHGRRVERQLKQLLARARKGRER